MTTPFKMPEKIVSILKNFSQLNPSLVISPDKVEVISTHKSAIGTYTFDEPLPMEDVMGLYDTSEFLSILSIYKTPDLTVSEKKVIISEGSSKVSYFLTAASLLPKVLVQNKYNADDIRKRINSLECEIDFVLPAEKLNMLLKMSSLLKSESIFFESVEGGIIRITVGDQLESSNNTWEIDITTDVNASTLEGALKLNVSDLRLIPSDYKVKISSKGMSSFVSSLGVEYFIGVFVV